MEKKLVKLVKDLRKVEQVETGKGNTKTLRVQQSKRWCFTFNNYTLEDLQFIINDCNKRGMHYIIGEEIGKVEQTPHLQGYIESDKKFRWSELKWQKTIHWEKCKGNRQENIDYCTKDGKIYYSRTLAPIMCINVLRPWQQNVVDTIINNPPDGRTVYWYHDECGCQGKSALCKYLYVKHKIPTIHGGKLSDIVNFIFNIPIMPNCLCIDIPRNNQNHISYSAIECILNGMIFNTKFETGVKVFNPPHIIVFSNCLPDIGAMSYDRWKIISLGENHQT